MNILSGSLKNEKTGPVVRPGGCVAAVPTGPFRYAVSAIQSTGLFLFSAYFLPDLNSMPFIGS